MLAQLKKASAKYAPKNSTWTGQSYHKGSVKIVRAHRTFLATLDSTGQGSAQVKSLACDSTCMGVWRCSCVRLQYVLLSSTSCKEHQWGNVECWVDGVVASQRRTAVVALTADGGTAVNDSLRLLGVRCVCALDVHTRITLCVCCTSEGVQVPCVSQTTLPCLHCPVHRRVVQLPVSAM